MNNDCPPGHTLTKWLMQNKKSSLSGLMQYGCKHLCSSVHSTPQPACSMVIVTALRLNVRDMHWYSHVHWTHMNLGHIVYITQWGTLISVGSADLRGYLNLWRDHMTRAWSSDCSHSNTTFSWTHLKGKGKSHDGDALRVQWCNCRWRWSEHYIWNIRCMSGSYIFPLQWNPV